jgi:hypothetical protein
MMKFYLMATHGMETTEIHLIIKPGEALVELDFSSKLNYLEFLMLQYWTIPRRIPCG